MYFFEIVYCITQYVMLYALITVVSQFTTWNDIDLSRKRYNLTQPTMFNNMMHDKVNYWWKLNTISNDSYAYMTIQNTCSLHLVIFNWIYMKLINHDLYNFSYFYPLLKNSVGSIPSLSPLIEENYDYIVYLPTHGPQWSLDLV